MDPSAAIGIIETDLRDLVRLVLTASMGPDWLERVLTVETRNALELRREEEGKRRAPAEVPTSLLSYTHLYELRSIIEHEARWQSFAGALGHRKEFGVLMDKVEDYRNAPSHGRELLPHEASMLEGIAGEIRSRVVTYRSSLAPDKSYYPSVELISDPFGKPTDESQKPLNIVVTNLRVKPGTVLRYRCRGWDPQGRDLRWSIGKHSGLTERAIGTDVVIEYTVTEDDVGEAFYVVIRMSSDGRFHRHTYYDEEASFKYSVDPP